MVTSGLVNESIGGSGCGMDGPATVLSSSSASRWAKASSSSMLGCVGYINGDDALLAGRDAERRGVSEAREICEEIGDSDTGNGVGNENDEAVEGIVEGPASGWGTGIRKDACLIDSWIAFFRSSSSSSSWEILTECSSDSFLERAITRLSSASSACLTSLSNL